MDVKFGVSFLSILSFLGIKIPFNKYPYYLIRIPRILSILNWRVIFFYKDDTKDKKNDTKDILVILFK